MKVVKDRAKDYAPPKVNFSRIALLWEAYLKGIGGRPLTRNDVAPMMILLKISRLMHKYDHDGMKDIKGYAECLRLLNENVEGG